MKIAVPTYRGGLDDYVFEHFGKAPTFTTLGVDVVICCGMGVKAITLFKSYGIGVYIARNGSKVKEAIEDFLAGRLVEADESFGCRH